MDSEVVYLKKYMVQFYAINPHPPKGVFAVLSIQCKVRFEFGMPQSFLKADEKNMDGKVCR
jgi:hypothetical protein